MEEHVIDSLYTKVSQEQLHAFADGSDVLGSEGRGYCGPRVLGMNGLLGTGNMCDSPDVYISLPFSIVDRRELDLAEDDGAVGRRGTPTFDKVLSDGECDKVFVGDTVRARPHTRLVLIPVVTRFEDLGLDLVLDDLEGLYGLLGRTMGRVQLNLFLGSCSATGT